MTGIGQQPHAVISRGMVVLGDLVVSGQLIVEGTVYGNITEGDGVGAHVAVRGNGVVNGNVRATTAVIDGFVNGTVHTTERTCILAGARVSGDVRYSMVEVQLGALVDGRFLREEPETSGKVVALKPNVAVPD